jgi:hypothetical protein
MAAVGRHVVVPAVVLGLRGKTEIVAFQPVLIDWNVFEFIVEYELGTQVDELGAEEEKVTGFDAELDVLEKQAGIELEIEGLVAEVEGGDDVGVTQGADVPNLILSPRGAVDPPPVFDPPFMLGP